jgi:hypothetical protein
MHAYLHSNLEFYKYEWKIEKSASYTYLKIDFEQIQ